MVVLSDGLLINLPPADFACSAGVIIELQLLVNVASTPMTLGQILRRVKLSSQGTLTEGEGSIQFTSSLRYPVL